MREASHKGGKRSVPHVVPATCSIETGQAARGCRKSGRRAVVNGGARSGHCLPSDYTFSVLGTSGLWASCSLGVTQMPGETRALSAERLTAVPSRHPPPPPRIHERAAGSPERQRAPTLLPALKVVPKFNATAYSCFWFCLFSSETFSLSDSLSVDISVGF